MNVGESCPYIHLYTVQYIFLHFNVYYVCKINEREKTQHVKLV